MRVAFLRPALDAASMERLCAQLGPGITVRSVPAVLMERAAPPRPRREEPPLDESAVELVREADVVIGARFNRDVLDALKPSAVVIVPFAGIPESDQALFRTRPDVTVCNLHYNAPFVAEHAFALLLAVAKRIVPFDALLRQNEWDEPVPGRASLTLRGRWLGLLGYGAIGRELAAIGHGFGMRVAALQRRPVSGEPPAPLAYLGGAGDLETLLRLSDFLVVCVPLTDETRGLLGERELGWLKPSTVLVNIARGPIIQEEALYRALVQGRIAGAGLDVWYRYPDRSGQSGAPSDFPFGELLNVVLSPHRAADVVERQEAQLDALAVELNWLNAGKAPRNAVLAHSRESIL